MKEQDIIHLFENLGHLTPSSLIKGIGDDAAVVALTDDEALAITIDTMVEGVHFLKQIPPYALGYKALAISLSDIAAMGARPEFFVLSLGLPANTKDHYIKEIARGIKQAAQSFQVTLIGGDTVRAPYCLLTTAVWGKVHPQKVLWRSAARPGDVILVSGFLGEAAAGLELLKRSITIEDREWSSLIRAHLFPEPEVELGQLLSASGLVHAAIDISDGIATDLSWICSQSRVGAVIFKEKLPISQNCLKAARFLKADPLSWALSGGEDYKLLFTVPKEHLDRLKEILPKKVFEIGQIVEGEGVKLMDASGHITDITYKGYDHFNALASHLPV